MLSGNKLIPELHLRQPGFSYSALGPFKKHHQRIKTFKETVDFNYIFKKEMDEACFAHYAAYSDSKDLGKETISDKILKDRAYEIPINSKYNGYQRELTSMGYKIFDKKTGSGAIATSKATTSLNVELTQELHTPKFKRRKTCAKFKGNIWAPDLHKMESLLFKIKLLNIYYM